MLSLKDYLFVLSYVWKLNIVLSLGKISKVVLRISIINFYLSCLLEDKTLIEEDMSHRIMVR